MSKYCLEDELRVIKKNNKTENKIKQIYTSVEEEEETFNNIVKNAYLHFQSLPKEDKDLERQKNAIIGEPTAVNFYISEIDDYIRNNNLGDEKYPDCYANLTAAIFHENWGVSAIAEWLFPMNDEMKNSSSAKIIGDDIWYLIDGTPKKSKHKMKRERRNQLRTALFLKNSDKQYDEVPTVDTLTGERIKLFNSEVTRPDGDVIIFRKFPIKDYTFEKQIELGTYPKECLEFCKACAKVGFNMAFVGAVRTSKTTQLGTWLAYEDNTLEGLIIQELYELPSKYITNGAPLIDIIASGEKLKQLKPSLMQTDCDYVIIAEARDGYAYDIGLKCATIGTRRSKITAHIQEAEDFPYSMAQEICRVYGGNVDDTSIMAVKAWNITLSFIQLEDKSQKRLEGIYFNEYNRETHTIKIHNICKYDIDTDSWKFNYEMPKSFEEIGKRQNRGAFAIMKNELKTLADKFPFDEDMPKYTIPFYSRGTK